MAKRNLFFSAALAGWMIGMGGMIYVGSGRGAVGAVLFAVGLFAVCTRGMALYTGRVGYLIGGTKRDAADLAGIWLGNLLGAVGAGLLYRVAQPNLIYDVAQMAARKLAQSPLQTVALGVFCGLLMYLAVDHYRRSDGMTRYIGIFVCVPAFILAGFEHVVADMFYFAAGLTGWDQLSRAVVFLLLCTVGNSLGAWMIPAWDRLCGQIN